MAEKTTYIILRKIPFQDSSLIVSGLSPEFGRLDFLLRGARGTGAKKFPYAELFRELAIEFRPPKLHSPGTMCNLTSHELSHLSTPLLSGLKIISGCAPMRHFC